MAGHSGVPAIPATWGSTNRRITVKVGSDIKQNPTLKTTNTERARGVVKVVEHLLASERP
jgi:hypothetical protein